MAIRVQKEPIDSGTALRSLTNDNRKIGGVCAFTGLVRDINHGDTIKTLTLEHYPGMTEKGLARIETQALERWDLEASLIIHRYGTMTPGEVIVLVAAASQHRHAAFDACQFMMDYLKTDAPFWKIEDKTDRQEWVTERQSDTMAKARWSDN